jgi:DNA-binding transcriptional LysR family regulator
VQLPAGHPLAPAPGHVPLAALAGGALDGRPRRDREGDDAAHLPRLGGFDPDIRHRANDATISLALVARGLAVTLLPELPLPPRIPGVALRTIAEGAVDRAIFAATRAADAARPSTRALVAAVRDAAAALPYG